MGRMDGDTANSIAFQTDEGLFTLASPEAPGVLHRECQRLNQVCERWRRENEKLKAECERSRSDCANLRLERERLDRANDQLQAERDKFKVDGERLQSRVSQLEVWLDADQHGNVSVTAGENEALRIIIRLLAKIL